MKPDVIFVVALDDEADRLAAEIVYAIRQELPAVEAGYVPDVQPLQASLEPCMYGVGGDRMRSCPVEFIADYHGINHDGIYRALLEREPDVILCVGDNPLYSRLAHA